MSFDARFFFLMTLTLMTLTFDFWVFLLQFLYLISMFTSHVLSFLWSIWQLLNMGQKCNLGQHVTDRDTSASQEREWQLISLALLSCWFFFPIKMFFFNVIVCSGQNLVITLCSLATENLKLKRFGLTELTNQHPCGAVSDSAASLWGSRTETFSARSLIHLNH